MCFAGPYATLEAMRRLGALLLILAGLAAAALLGDDLARRGVESRVAAQLAANEGLDADPAVHIADRPFLLAAASGEFDEVRVSAPDVTTQGVSLRFVQTTLNGVHFSPGEVIGGGPANLRADRVTVEALLTYPELTALLRSQLDDQGVTWGNEPVVTAGEAGGVQVAGGVEIAGLSIDLALPMQIEITDGRLRLSTAPGDDAAAQIPARIDLSLTIPDLPYGLTVDEVRSEPDGVLLIATGADVSIDG